MKRQFTRLRGRTGTAQKVCYRCHRTISHYAWTQHERACLKYYLISATRDGVLAGGNTFRLGPEIIEFKKMSEVAA